MNPYLIGGSILAVLALIAAIYLKGDQAGSASVRADVNAQTVHTMDAARKSKEQIYEEVARTPYGVALRGPRASQRFQRVRSSLPGVTPVQPTISRATSSRPKRRSAARWQDSATARSAEKGMLLAVAVATPALGHGDAAWIEVGGYVDAAGVH